MVEDAGPILHSAPAIAAQHRDSVAITETRRSRIISCPAPESALLELGADALPDDELFIARGPLNPPAPNSTIVVDADGVVSAAVECDMEKLWLRHNSCPSYARFTLTRLLPDPDRAGLITPGFFTDSTK